MQTYIPDAELHVVVAVALVVVALVVALVVVAFVVVVVVVVVAVVFVAVVFVAVAFAVVVFVADVVVAVVVVDVFAAVLVVVFVVFAVVFVGVFAAVVVVSVVVLVAYAAAAFVAMAAAAVEKAEVCFFLVRFPFHPVLQPGSHSCPHSLEQGGQRWQWGAGLPLRSLVPSALWSLWEARVAAAMKALQRFPPTCWLSSAPHLERSPLQT